MEKLSEIGCPFQPKMNKQKYGRYGNNTYQQDQAPVKCKCFVHM